jgi:hypothetical protein
VFATARVNPLPDCFDDPCALALAKFEMLGRSENAAFFRIGLDLVEVGDHCQDFVILVLLHAFRDRLEELASTMAPAATALAFCVLLAKTGVRAVAIDGQVACRVPK